MQLADVLYPLLVIAFFAVAAALVVACDRIIGPDESVATADDIGTDAEARAA